MAQISVRVLSVGLFVGVCVVGAAVPANGQVSLAQTEESDSLVTEADRQAILDRIRALHTAYAKKDLERVLSLERYQQKVNAHITSQSEEAVTEASRQRLLTLFTSPAWGMKPLNLSSVRFITTHLADWGYVIISSTEPIILSNDVPVKSPAPMRVEYRCFRVGRLKNGRWRLTLMYVDDWATLTGAQGPVTP